MIPNFPLGPFAWLYTLNFCGCQTFLQKNCRILMVFCHFYKLYTDSWVLSSFFSKETLSVSQGGYRISIRDYPKQRLSHSTTSNTDNPGYLTPQYFASVDFYEMQRQSSQRCVSERKSNRDKQQEQVGIILKQVHVHAWRRFSKSVSSTYRTPRRTSNTNDGASMRAATCVEKP